MLAAAGDEVCTERYCVESSSWLCTWPVSTALVILTNLFSVEDVFYHLKYELVQLGAEGMLFVLVMHPQVLIPCAGCILVCSLWCIAPF
jgi:hypothetical protein